TSSVAGRATNRGQQPPQGGDCQRQHGPRRDRLQLGRPRCLLCRFGSRRGISSGTQRVAGAVFAAGEGVVTLTGKPGLTRIVAGKWRGRRLQVPAGRAVRPTAERVREAWLSILAPELPGANVLDLFA